MHRRQRALTAASLKQPLQGYLGNGPRLQDPANLCKVVHEGALLRSRFQLRRPSEPEGRRLLQTLVGAVQGLGLEVPVVGFTLKGFSIPVVIEFGEARRHGGIASVRAIGSPRIQLRLRPLTSREAL